LAPSDLSDPELVTRFLEGDTEAFTTLTRRHEDKIFAIAWRITGDRSDALDATQDALITVYRKVGSWRGESAFSTWLYRIVVNATRDVMRKKGRAPIPEEEVTPRPSSDDVEGEVTTRLDVRRALMELPEDYREAVVMHDIGGIPYEEIAEATGVALGTVKSRISRGRKKLARSLEPTRDPGAS
jgi:RNA polymerase sigma-70 factor, ECF subfamily